MLLQDVRYAWRSLTKSRGFTAIAVACLALGIGINTTIFSVVDGVMLQPYPYQDPDGIAIVHSRNQRMHINRADLSYADYKDLRDQTGTLQSLAAFSRRSLTISDGSTEPTRSLSFVPAPVVAAALLFSRRTPSHRSRQQRRQHQRPDLPLFTYESVHCVSPRRL